MSEQDERETLADQQDQHRWIGVVNSREGWSECECGAHLPTILDSDGYAIDEDAYNRVMAEHRADMLLASDWLAEHDRAVEARARADHLAFTKRLGFGDGVTEPAATLEQMIDPIEQAFSEASEYREGPRICEPCGEWLATQTCEHCYGSGCGPGTASGAYEECEWCAGVGKVHPGCVEKSYADLVAENAALRADRLDPDAARGERGAGK